MLVFALLVFGTMRWIWPLILGAMEERSRKIAQGLAAAEKGEQELAAARDRAEAIVREARSEEHTSELQSRLHLVCRLLLEKKKKNIHRTLVSSLSCRCDPLAVTL